MLCEEEKQFTGYRIVYSLISNLNSFLIITKKIAKLPQSCDSYCIQNWQLLYALLPLTTFICIIASNIFRLHGSWQCLYTLFSFHIFCMSYLMWHLGCTLCTFCNQELLHWTIEIDKLWISHKMFVMVYCKWHLVYALLQLPLFALLYTLITFIFTIANNHSFHMYYSHWKIVYELLKGTTFVCRIAMDNFCMHCYKR